MALAAATSAAPTPYSIFSLTAGVAVALAAAAGVTVTVGPVAVIPAPAVAQAGGAGPVVVLGGVEATPPPAIATATAAAPTYPLDVSFAVAVAVAVAINPSAAAPPPDIEPFPDRPSRESEGFAELLTSGQVFVDQAGTGAAEVILAEIEVAALEVLIPDGVEIELVGSPTATVIRWTS